MHCISSKKYGFTLIEISIVLVIIGLIVGGVLAGRDLIDAAAQRAQIAQIEKYNTAVHAFQSKYGYLPGDIPSPAAQNFGFQIRGSFDGEGDGNGVITGNCSNAAGGYSNYQVGCGELPVFWQDLSTTRFIDLNVPVGFGYPSLTVASVTTATTTPSIQNWLPNAKIGQSVYVYIIGTAGINYFVISTVTKIGWNIESSLNPGVTVQQAYNIDKKIDDGLPLSGSVTACYENYTQSNAAGAGDARIWAAAGTTMPTAQYPIPWGPHGYDGCQPTTAATASNIAYCFDNNNTAGVAPTYSLTQNASLLNCALSFKFQ